MATLKLVRVGQVWGHYAGAARRRVHLAMVLLRPPSGHRQADAKPAMPVSFR